MKKDIPRLCEAAKRVLKGAKAYVGTEYSQDGDAQALADAWLVCFEPENLKDVNSVIAVLCKHAGEFEHKCRSKGHAGEICHDDLSAWCGYCGDELGWYCPTSPDSVCHYAGADEDEYELMDGSTMEVPIAPHGERYYYDCCVICGEPSERK